LDSQSIINCIQGITNVGYPAEVMVDGGALSAWAQARQNAKGSNN